MAASFLQLQTGDHLLLQDGTGAMLLQYVAPSPGSGAGAGSSRPRKTTNFQQELDRQRRQRAFDDALIGRANAETQPIPAGRTKTPTIQNPYAVTYIPAPFGEAIAERVFVAPDREEEDMRDVAFVLEHLRNLADEEEVAEIMAMMGKIPR